MPLRLPPEILPVTAKLVNVPTEVMLPCAAVVNEPVIFVPLRLPLEILPVADINPLVNILPPVILPAANIPIVVTLPVAETAAPCISNELNKLPPVTLAVTLTLVPVSSVTLMLPPVILPVTLLSPVVYVPVLAITNTFDTPATRAKILPFVFGILNTVDPLTKFVPANAALLINPPSPNKNAPVTLPVALTSPTVFMLPPVMLAVVEMSAVEFSALITFALKLSPAALILPPTILPTVAILPPVILPVTGRAVITLPVKLS